MERRVEMGKGREKERRGEGGGLPWERLLYDFSFAQRLLGLLYKPYTCL